MKIRTIRYIVKEGIINTYKNKLMSLASISVIIASLVVFGIFLLMVMNFNHNTRVLKQQIEMQAFCEYELDDYQISIIEQKIKKNDKIEGYTKVTREEAFKKFKERLGDDSSVLEGYDETLLPVSFIIKVKDPGYSQEVAEEIKKIDGIRRIAYSKEVTDFIIKFTKWVNLVSVFLILILLTVSVFIIANTIKLTVFARRREINIMKYIGATDWFIRWPFIVEGVIIGIVGSLVAFFIVNYGYNAIESRFNSEMFVISRNFIQLVNIDKVKVQIVLYFCLLGGLVGSAGSVVSLRKHLKV
jgi:cell division transport system permease protein